MPEHCLQLIYQNIYDNIRQIISIENNKISITICQKRALVIHSYLNALKPEWNY